jgi:spore maturation protein CgeB
MEERGMDVTYLPFAWDPSVFERQERPNSWKHEISFVGNWDEKRERILNRVAEHFDLKVWGSEYWQTHTSPDSPVRACWQGGGLFGGEASKAIVESKVTLNILRDQNCPDGTNMRTFEIPGAGGFALATATMGAKEIFPEGEAGAYFNDTEDLLKKIDYYLDNAEERERIAATARNVVQKHTYEKRAKRITNI